MYSLHQPSHTRQPPRQKKRDAPQQPCPGDAPQSPPPHSLGQISLAGEFFRSVGGIIIHHDYRSLRHHCVKLSHHLAYSELLIVSRNDNSYRLFQHKHNLFRIFYLNNTFLQSKTREHTQITKGEVDLAALEAHRRIWPFFRDRSSNSYRGIPRRSRFSSDSWHTSCRGST